METKPLLARLLYIPDTHGPPTLRVPHPVSPTRAHAGVAGIFHAEGRDAKRGLREYDGMEGSDRVRG